MELKMASKCALAAQIGAQVQLGSPSWQYKSNLEPNLAPKWALEGRGAGQAPSTLANTLYRYT